MSTTNPAEVKKRLALAIVDFLQSSTTDGTLPPDDKESIEVAVSCIADAFKVDATDSNAIGDALGPGQSLFSIYGVYEKLRGKTTPSAQGSSSATAASPSTPVTPTPSTSAKNPAAETLKQKGNAAMQAKNHTQAVDFYSQAIELSPTDPIYLSNRAAAYSATQQHDLARQDAELATASDPNYTKAWSRLGLARFALGDVRGSMDAYKSGIDAEGNGGSDAMKKGYETAKRKLQEQDDDDDVASPRSTSPMGGAGGMPDLGSLASMLGGGGGAGGMPDLAGLMNNPMMRQMAQNVMSNPDMMSNIMNNPRMREMAGQFGGGGGGAGAGGEAGAEAGQGGGMPDLSALMQDPNIAEM